MRGASLIGLIGMGLLASQIGTRPISGLSQIETRPAPKQTEADRKRLEAAQAKRDRRAAKRAGQ
jgi:hypothetical protein